MFILSFVKFLLFLLPPLIGVAFFTLLERKVLSLVGLRVGPNKVSFVGLLQPIGDALKLSNKEVNSLSMFSLFFYYVSSVCMLSISIFLYSCLEMAPNFYNFTYPTLILLLCLGLNSLNSIVLGWSAFSKFSLLGSVRTLAQLISYEGVLFICVFFPICMINSFDMSTSHFYDMSLGLFIYLPCFLIWFPTILAELNRTPYDFSEGESELVSGFNTEFSSGCFTLIFLAEYGSILFFSLFTFFLFFFPVLPFIFYMFFFFIWIRSVLPRYRFDKLMELSWKFFIPFLTMIFVLFYLYLF